MELSELIKSRREELGLTLKEVADYVGVSEGTVSRWESGGIGNPKRDKIGRLAKLLKLPPAVLVGNEEPEDLSDYLEELRTRPEMRMLFDSSRGMTTDQIKAVVQMIENLKNN